jgi:DNA-binding GntR family transcriptional regulator
MQRDDNDQAPSEMTRRKSQKRYAIVEQIMRDNIASGILPPGLVLLEGPIAELLQMSRAPVQRALTSLAAENLVHRFEGRGYLVGPPDRGVNPRRMDIKSFSLVIPEQADEALQSRSSWERIYDEIERNVAGCVIFGQYRIIETELAGHFNVSRTVVRDVLSRLQERGLVRKNQSSHWIAGPLTAQLIKQRFELRRILEPPALISGAPFLNMDDVGTLFEKLKNLEPADFNDYYDDLEVIRLQFIAKCVLSTPNEQLRELISNNLLPLTASKRLLRQLGLPVDSAMITELRLVLELILRGATEAAAQMLDSHLEASMKRTIEQMKIVAIVPGPAATEKYLTRIM